MFSMTLGVGQGPPSPSTSPITIEIIMVSMILGIGRGLPSPPTSPKNYGNHNVSNDFGGWAGVPTTSPQVEINMLSMILGVGQGAHRLPPPQKTIGIMMFSMIFEVGWGFLSPPKSQKNSGNLHVWMILGDRGLLAVWTHAFPQVSGVLLCGLRPYSTIQRSKKTNGFENLKIWIDLYGFG